MGYYNPIHAYGTARFATDAAAAGVDGLIVVDLPPEEDEVLRVPAQAQGLDLIRLATPTTDDARLQTILDGASGFLYYVSIAGVTGTKASPEDEVARGAGAHPQGRHRSALRGGLRHQDAGAGRRDRPDRRWRGGGLGHCQPDRGQPGRRRRTEIVAEVLELCPRSGRFHPCGAPVVRCAA